VILQGVINVTLSLRPYSTWFGRWLIVQQFNARYLLKFYKEKYDICNREFYKDKDVYFNDKEG